MIRTPLQFAVLGMPLLTGSCATVTSDLGEATHVGRLAMKPGPPALVALDPDDYSAQHVGRTAEGLQFFLTTPFVPATGGDAGREFIALYLFQADGSLFEARIDDLGTRSTVDPESAKALIAKHLSSLGRYSRCRIEMQPFRVERFGTAFGLIPRPPEDDDESWWVELQPGNYMAFHEPWDSGEYDT